MAGILDQGIYSPIAVYSFRWDRYYRWEHSKFGRPIINLNTRKQEGSLTNRYQKLFPLTGEAGTRSR